MKSDQRNKLGRKTNKKITKPALMKAIEIVGGVTNLASKIEVHQPDVSTWLYTDIKIPSHHVYKIVMGSTWLYTDIKIPSHHVYKIVMATNGKIKPEDLRPDVFIKIPNFE